MTPAEETPFDKRIAALEDKIAELQKQSRARVISTITLGILFGTYALYHVSAHRILSGRWVGLHDHEGHLRSWSDDTGLELKDTEGRTRAKLGLSPEGWPSLQFFDDAANLRSNLFLYTDGSGYLMLWDKDGKGVRYPPPSKPLP